MKLVALVIKVIAVNSLTQRNMTVVIFCKMEGKKIFQRENLWERKKKNLFTGGSSTLPKKEMGKKVAKS